jgi:ABC-type phosphonate transport system ATPase subunit
MLMPLDSGLRELLQRAGEQRELLLDSGHGMVRIDLKSDNLALWQDTQAGRNASDNLLVACESHAGALSDTKLTWVVGSAIRSTQIQTAAEGLSLLLQLGVSDAQAKVLKENSPGLGDGLTWAVYLDRHGWLSASPVPKPGELSEWLVA